MSLHCLAVSVSYLFAVMKYPDKSNSGEKGFASAHDSMSQPITVKQQEGTSLKSLRGYQEGII